ncbi:MAG: cellulase family glycosylhydrolase [Lachnospiraceae bacterium]|nr:cellulase family glycosylhydrolase [Lachnospiraceae bacterium]
MKRYPFCLCLILLLLLAGCGKDADSKAPEAESAKVLEPEDGQEEAREVPDGNVAAEKKTGESRERESEHEFKPAPTDGPTPTSKPTPTMHITADVTFGDGNESPQNGGSSSGKTAVAEHGRLSYKGTKMVDSHGNAFQLRGVSTHGIGWFPQYVNRDTFKTLRDEWGVNCIRLAMYSDEGAGYASGGNQAQLKQLVNDGVSYATELGMYVIIDWHVLGEKDPNVHKDEAKKFFDEMSKKYASYENVLYEICNEPNGNTSWKQVKSYAEELVGVIRANDGRGIIIVGTPTWSQDVDVAASDPLKGYDNIAYTIHFYAGTHKDKLRQKMQSALKAGLPVLCTEFGTCAADGNGKNDFPEADKWIAAFDEEGIGFCIWNLSNKNESSSLISSGCNKLAGWTENELSDEGRWYVKKLGGGTKPLGSTAQSGNGGGNGGNNGGGGNNQANAVPAVNATAANTKITLSNDNSWNDGTAEHYQFTLKLTNSGSSPTSGWKVRIDMGSAVTIEQSWNGTFHASGSSITVTPVDFNKEIPAGGSVEAGFIVTVSGKIGNPSVSME